MKENVATLLEAVADEVGDEVAVVHGVSTVTWRELDERASRLAGHLAGRGVGRDARVAVGLYNSVEYVETVLAVLKLRAVPVNVNYRYGVDELEHVLRDSGAVACVVDGDLVDRIVEVAGRTDAAAFVHVGGETPPVEGWVDHARAVRESEPLPRQERGDDLWMLYTGGTTGRPRAVVSRHSWVTRVCVTAGFAVLGQDAPGSVAELRERVRELAATGRHVCLPAAPLIHGAGIYNTLATLVTGGTVVFAGSRSLDGDEIGRTIERHGVRQLAIVGDAFALPIIEAFERAAAAGRPYDLSSLRLVSSAGVAWSGRLKRRLLELCDGRVTCQEIVSATEGGPFAVSRVDSVEEAATARFRLGPGARVLDAFDRDVVPGSGAVGVLAAPTDDHVHYLDDPDRTRRTFRVIDGQRYCILGDLAVLEADGTLVFRGRGSDVINTGGEKVYAAEVEQVIAALPEVRDVVVLGVPDERWGQRVAALVAPRPDVVLEEAQVDAAVRSQLAGYKRPREIHILDALRRSPAGKIDLGWARRVIEERQSSGVRAAGEVG